MALNKFFRFPFAVTGDKAAIPDDTQLSGDVSFEQGYGPDYARDPAIDPLAKNIERDKMNQLFFDVTTALREYQIMGTPDFITSVQNGGTAFPYSKLARVRYDDGTGFKIYESKIDTNTDLPTVSASWAQVSSFDFSSYLATQAEAVAGTDNTKYMSPLRVSQAVPSATESTAGRLQIATAAQARAYASDAVALTPLKMKQAMQGSNASFAANGYQKLPGGLIIQWLSGISVGPNAGVDFTWPIAFPTAVFSASVAGQTSLEGGDVVMNFRSVTITGGRISNGNGTETSANSRIIGIGY